MELWFTYGASMENFEAQANSQGYTIGDFAETAQKVGEAIVTCYINNMIPKSIYDKAVDKHHKLMMKFLSKIENSKQEV